MKLNRFNMLISAVLFIIFKPIEADSSYIIPQPIIRVFRPRGFEVSIPYVEGIQEFRFSANRNEPLPNFSDPRQIQFSRSAFEPDPSGRMSVQDRVARFRRADRFYYQIMVVKDDQYYHSEKEIFSVESNDIFDQPKYDPAVEAYYRHKTTTVPSTNPPDQTSLEPTYEIKTPFKPEDNKDLIECNAKVYSLVEKVSWLATEIDRLSDDNRLLKKIGNEVPEATMLFLSGRIPRTEDPTQVVIRVLRKLDLTPEILTAKWSEENLIQFQVESVQVKMEILQEANGKLENNNALKIFD